VAERLTAAVDSTVWLALQDLFVAAAEEITCELASGSVELRVRGRDPEFVVRQPAGLVDGLPGRGPAGAGTAEEGRRPPTSTSATLSESEKGGTARVDLRLTDHLKARAEHAALGERISLDAWVVKAVAAALNRANPPRRDVSSLSSQRQHYVGWRR
jgi:hypothetical protein